MNKVWGPRPLNLAVVEVLQRKGPLVDDDLTESFRLADWLQTFCSGNLP